jgi:hypothetical protein
MDKPEYAHPKASRLRLTAAELRARASTHGSLRRILLTLADAYDHAAAFLEGRRRCPRGPLH